MLDCLVRIIERIGRTVGLRQLRHQLDSRACTGRNLSLAFRTTLGGNQDNTIRTLHTIHGGGRSILQYRNRLYGMDINTRHRALDTIYKYERI